MSQHDNGVPMFARGRNDERDTTELRVEIPKAVMNVIDATWQHRTRHDAKASRNSVANEILGAWAKEKWHEATMDLNLAPNNPMPPESQEASS